MIASIVLFILFLLCGASGVIALLTPSKRLDGLMLLALAALLAEAARGAAK